MEVVWTFTFGCVYFFFQILFKHFAVISKLSIETPSHLLLNNDISEMFSLVKTVVENLFNIVAFLIPSVTISPPSSIKFPPILLS